MLIKYRILVSGETFILYNQQVKGKKRELIQLGVPIFGQIKDDAASKLQKSMKELYFDTYYLCLAELFLKNSYNNNVYSYRPYRANSSTSTRCH